MPRQHKRSSYGTGSLYERKNANGTVSWVGQWMTDGVRRKQTLGRKTRTLNKTKARRALRRAMESATGPVAERRTLRQVWEEHERYLRDQKGRKPSTIRGYRSIAERHLFPTLGDKPVDRLTQVDIDRFSTRLSESGASAQTQRNVLGLLTRLLAMARKRKWMTRSLEIDMPEKRKGGAIRVFSAEEVRALSRATEDEQDAAIFLTAALTGLRKGELLALRWRDLDFPGSAIRVEGSFAGGQLTSPKSGKVRSVPMAPEVAAALVRLGQRERFTDGGDLVFSGTTGGYLDGSALRKRYIAARDRAKLRPLRFHDLRHTFGTIMIARADIRRVQHWMGHADIDTTSGYLHFVPRKEDAALVAEAFAPAVEEVEVGA